MTVIFTLITLAAAGQSKFDPKHIAVIPADSHAYWPVVLSGNKPYNLSKEEIRLADSLINICISENNNNGKPTNTIGIYVGLHTFMKQLVPSMNENGEVIVWANCLCEDFIKARPKGKDQPDWKKEVIQVHDGGVGGCFFHVMLNLTTGKYYALYVNGI